NQELQKGLVTDLAEPTGSAGNAFFHGLQAGCILFVPDAVKVRAPADEEFAARQGQRGVGLVVHLVGGEDFELGALFKSGTGAFAAKNINSIFRRDRRRINAEKAFQRLSFELSLSRPGVET